MGTKIHIERDGSALLISSIFSGTYTRSLAASEGAGGGGGLRKGRCEAVLVRTQTIAQVFFLFFQEIIRINLTDLISLNLPKSKYLSLVWV